MTARETFSDAALSIEQSHHLQELSRTLTPAQVRWISGYFAGLDAGFLRLGQGDAPPAPAAPSAGSRTLTILYGTETGNSRELAKALSAAAGEKGLSAKVADMSAYKPRSLKNEQDVLIIVSTYGEGDPPQPAVGFFEFIEGSRAPKLPGLRFAVLALGDSTYEKYCEAGKRLDRRFEELGAERLEPRVDCDIDYDEPAAAWSSLVVDRLAADLAKPALAAGAGTSVFPTARSYDKRNPFPATVLETIKIVGRQSSKETRHIELDISGSELSHEPGDALGIAAFNEAAVVTELLDTVSLSPDATVAVKGQQKSLFEALERNYEVTLATPRFLDQWAKLSGASALAELRGEERSAERLAFLHNHHVIDVVRRFPVGGVSAEDLLTGLRPLQPRLYSIASSLAAVPDEVHLTLSPVRYELHGTRRNGVASAHLADRAGQGETLPVYIQANPHFRLPGGDVPIIMIGAGTGVAPYRAFLQEREARGASGRSWLFFGERNSRSDFLYQLEWQEHLKSGILSRMDVAFSRDAAAKAYVQHRMLERAADLYAWLEEGAHVYVCGDATSMAPDVNEALVSVVAEQGRISREAAEDYVRKLAADHRYQRDVY
jgi:sulfite reductase (NADPH) flavoprotein alpha-component